MTIDSINNTRSSTCRILQAFFDSANFSGRTFEQQLMHWIRLGMEAENNDSDAIEREHLAFLDKLAKQIISSTTNAGKNGMREWEYANKCRLWKKSSQHDRQVIFDSLVSAGRLAMAIPEKRKFSRGYAPKRPVYFLPEYFPKKPGQNPDGVVRAL